MSHTIYLVPHTHYDVVWAFNKEDYFLIFVKILRYVVRMIEEHDFRFLIEQAYPLEMLEHRNPELFAEIEALIREGKIEIVDGQYLMADPIIPGGEVLVREILLGKRYCREKFDVEIPVAWAADGFGLNAQLPQIYRKSGYEWLAFRRGLPKWIGSRVSEFYWEGIDGSRIPAHWMPLGYRAGLYLDKWEEAFDHLKELATTSHILMPCGSGGAIPQEEIPRRVKEWNADHENAEMIVTTPGDYFRAFDNAEKELITFEGELYSDELESIFPDVSSSRVRLRLAIRDCEHLLILAEKAATLAFLHGRPYPSETLNELWKKKSFLAMHDVVPGCGIDEIYEDAWEYIREMKKTLPAMTRNSILQMLPGKSRGMNIVVFNPNNWAVNNWVEADVDFSEGGVTRPGIRCDGEEIESELVQAERWDDGSIRKARIGFITEVPSLGCRSFRVVDKTGESQNGTKTERSDTDVTVTSAHFALKVDKKTGILTAKDLSGNTLFTGNEIIIDEEVGDLYFHKSQLDKRIGSESGEGLHFGIFKPGDLTVDQGPVRTIITFKNTYYCLRWPYYLIDKFEPVLYRHKTLEVTKRVIVYNDMPRIDFATDLELHQSHVRIRLKFDTGMVAPRYTRQTQFGVLDLPEDKTLQASHKIPSLTWIHCVEDSRGLAFMTQGVPINEITGGEIYCTLLRSVSVLSADGISGPLVPTPEAQELGSHSYAYSVYPFTGNWVEAGVHRQAHETNQPLSAYQANFNPENQSCDTFSLEPDNLIISAIKKAEDNDDIILRFFETAGLACKAKLKLPPQISQVTVTNLLEHDQDSVDIANDHMLELDVSRFEIITLRLKSIAGVD
jgi:alpha-mannosidase